MKNKIHSLHDYTLGQQDGSHLHCLSLFILHLLIQRKNQPIKSEKLDQSVF